MGGRDHSETCEVCGVQRGGIMDLPCRCDPHPMYGPCDEFGHGGTCSVCTDSVSEVRLCRESLEFLAANLRIGAALCAVWQSTFDNSLQWVNGRAVLWRPGCARPMTLDQGEAGR